MTLAAFLNGGPRGAAVASRVLLLGVGSVGAILALPFYDPEGSYLVLDDDPENIEVTRAAAAEIGLSNLRFEVVDWREPPLDLGAFDLVIACGVLGRVPEAARSEVLRLCRASLADEGILYLDYPLIPGAANRNLARSLLDPLIDGTAPAAKRLEQARAAAEAYRAMIAAANHPYPQMLALELARAAGSPDEVLWRDYITAPGTAFLHRDVVAMAGAHGLRTVCDAAFNRPEGFVPADIRAELSGRGLAGVEMEQALDILRNRVERGSIFCKAEAGESESPGPAILDELGIACALTPASAQPRLDPGVEEAFEGAAGERIASADPLLKAVVLELCAAWPRPRSFAELVSAGVERLHRAGADGEPSDEQVAALVRDFWALYMRGLVLLFLDVPRFAANGGRSLHALARFEAQAGRPLTTPLHTPLVLAGFDAALVQHLARSTEPAADEDTLVNAMLVHAVEGAVAIEVGGARLTDPMLLEPMVRGLVRRGLSTLGRWGLLEGE